ncbi:MAG: isoprenyl transferase [Thermodesulfobacteriota bacterium]
MMSKVPTDNLPAHIAIIMDGNGRWARKRILNRINGHRKGIETVRNVISHCNKIGIRYLTLYTFSKENWNRPKAEVMILMTLMERHLRKEKATMMRDNVRFKAIGNIAELPKKVRKVVAELTEDTAGNDGMTLQLALSYSGREEIVEAAKRVAALISSGELADSDVTEENFHKYLYTGDMPDPDLLIRTSGECRISNFLLYQLAYTEIHITDVLWPDFTTDNLMEAISDYQGRERRFGLTGEQKIERVG